jgi:hypothetical protein
LPHVRASSPTPIATGQQDDRLTQALSIAASNTLVNEQLARLQVESRQVLNNQAIKSASVQDSHIGMVFETDVLRQSDQGNSVNVTVDLAKGIVLCLQILRGSTWRYSVDVSSVIFDASRPAYEVPICPRVPESGMQVVQPRQEQQWSFNHESTTVKQLYPSESSVFI